MRSPVSSCSAAGCVSFRYCRIAPAARTASPSPRSPRSVQRGRLEMVQQRLLATSLLEAPGRPARQVRGLEPQATVSQCQRIRVQHFRRAQPRQLCPHYRLDISRSARWLGVPGLALDELAGLALRAGTCRRRCCTISRRPRWTDSGCAGWGWRSGGGGDPAIPERYPTGGAAAAHRTKHLFAVRVYGAGRGHRRNLELTDCGAGCKGSLLGVLDHTVTAMGKRLLRQWVSKPLHDVDPDPGSARGGSGILRRCSGRSCGRLMKPLNDLERLRSTRVLGGSALPRDLAAIRETLRRLPGLKALLPAELPALEPVQRDFQRHAAMS